MRHELFLSDEIQILPYIVKRYISGRIEERYPDLMESIEERANLVIENTFTRDLGKGWRKFLTQPEYKVYLHKVYFPDGMALDYSIEMGYSSLGCMTDTNIYFLKKMYPIFDEYDVMGKLKTEDIAYVSEMLYILLDNEYLISQELIESGVLDKNGRTILRTGEEIRSACPDLFEYWIEYYIKNTLGGKDVTLQLTTKEDEIKALKRWIS